MREVVEALRGIPDQLLLDPDAERLVDQVYARLGRFDYEGIAVHAPRAVNLDQQAELPLVLASRETAARSRRVVLGDSCFVAVTQLETGQFWTGPCFAPPPEKVPMWTEPGAAAPPSTEGLGEAAATHVVERIELRERLGLELQTGHYAITVFAYDWRSNTSLVKVTGGDAAPPRRWPAQEALAVLQSYQREGPSGAVFPDFRRSPYSPPLQGTGVSVNVPRSWSVDAGELPLHAAFMMAMPESWLVEPLSQDALGDLSPEESTLYTDLPQALVPMVVLLTRREVPSPIRLELKVPVAAPAAIKAGETGEGWLSVDLATAFAAPPEPGVYGVYVLAGPYVGGPQPLRVEAEQ